MSGIEDVEKNGNKRKEKAEHCDKGDWKLVVWEQFTNMTSIQTPQNPPPAF